MHVPDPLVEVGEGFPGDGAIPGRFQLPTGPDGQWLPNTAQVRPRWVWKLTWKISRVAVRRITTCWNRWLAQRYEVALS